MAVEAHHLHLFPSQLPRNREFMNAAENQSGVGLVAPVSGDGSFIPFYTPGATTATATDSGLTVNLASHQRKRSRDGDGTAVSFLGDDISSLVQQQMQEIDQIIAHHMERVRSELTERRRRFWGQALAAAAEGVSKRLREKEEEIERIGVLNWALEERVKGLCVENQMWRDLAQAHEAAAGALRANLEQVMAAQVRVKEEQQWDTAAAERAESCCCGDNREVYEGQRCEAAAAAGDWRRGFCRSCGEREPSVLLLPCRHLCLCAACGPGINACPICNCRKDGSVNVNII